MNIPLKISFVGNYSGSFTSEIADEVMLARELENLGHKVNKIPRDIWKAYVDGEWHENWKPYLEDLKSDINIICKWHHFNSSKYIQELKEKSGSPVFYWVWDFMKYEDFHNHMVNAADLYLGNDVVGRYPDQKNSYYFPFDVSDGNFDRIENVEKEFEVVFFGSCIGQGDRKHWLPIIAKECKLTVFSWNWEEWKKFGFDARPAVYGEEFAKAVAKSKVCLQFSVNDDFWGYWSNRVGKILTVGGFLLAKYAPGMELFLRDGVDYFSSPQEAIAKCKYYLNNPDERDKIANRGYQIGRDRFTAKARIKELEILIYRYLQGVK